MDIASYTSTGLVRKNNEDSCLVLPPWSHLAIKTGICAFGVADGMGGENSGEVASAIAIDTLKSWIGKVGASDLTAASVEELFSAANLAVWEYAQSNSASKGMGTTLTVIVIKGEKTFVGHIGDSRLYRYRDGQLEQLTSDHTLVAEQVRLGKITKNEARSHPTRHILSRVLGGRQFIVPDVFELELKVDDRFLLCTDGVYGPICDEDMAEEIGASDIIEIPEILVSASDKAGGRDNSTAIAFKVDALPILLSSFYSLERIKKTLSTKRMVGFV